MSSKKILPNHKGENNLIQSIFFPHNDLFIEIFEIFVFYGAYVAGKFTSGFRIHFNLMKEDPTQL